MDILLLIPIHTNILAAMLASALAVIMGVNIRELGLRVYVLILITAILIAAAVVETWFLNSTVYKAAAIGWGIGYITDDVLLTINALMPNFIRDLVDKVFNGIKKKVDKFFGIDDKDNFK